MIYCVEKTRSSCLYIDIDTISNNNTYTVTVDTSEMVLWPFTYKSVSEKLEGMYINAPMCCQSTGYTLFNM